MSTKYTSLQIEPIEPLTPKQTFFQKNGKNIGLFIAVVTVITGIVMGLQALFQHAKFKQNKADCKKKANYGWCDTKEKCLPSNCSTPTVWEDATCACTGCDTDKGLRCKGKCIAKCPANSTMNLTTCNCECSPGYKDMGGGVCELIATCKSGTVDDDGHITGATFYDPTSNTCQPGCDSTGSGVVATQEQCDKICKDKGYFEYHETDGKCVHKLACATTQVKDFAAANGEACHSNDMCRKNEANLDKLDIKMVNNDKNWTCTFPEASTWQTACTKINGATWNSDYCWVPKQACLGYTVIKTDNATVHLVAYLGNEALQNGINIEHDVAWVVTLSNGVQHYKYYNAVIGPAPPSTPDCPSDCKPCTHVSMSFNVLSESHENLPLPASYTLKLTAHLKENNTQLLGTDDGSATGPVAVAAASGSFDPLPAGFSAQLGELVDSLLRVDVARG